MLIQLMTIEVMLNSVVFMLLAFNRVHTGTQTGQVFGFFVIAIAAAEAAVGLAILMATSASKTPSRPIRPTCSSTEGATMLSNGSPPCSIVVLPILGRPD